MVIEEPRTLATGSDRPAPNPWAWLGLLIVFAGVVSYFVVFVRFPALRDFPWLNLPVVLVGLGLSAFGLRRTLAGSSRTLLGKVLGGLSCFASLVLTILFCVYVFFLSYQLPDTDGVVQVAQAAPEFTLPDQHEQMVRLSDLQGTLVVIDFYRGHW